MFKKKARGLIIILFLIALSAIFILSISNLPPAIKVNGSLPYLSVTFLDVGQADAAVVECCGHVMMIDGGNVSDSSYVYAYLKDHNISHIDSIVCTHAHEDHVGGLAAALNKCTAGTVYAPVKSYDSNAFRSFQNYVKERGLKITVPSPGTVFHLGSAKVTILGPLKPYESQNDRSIVLKIEYGKTAFLFTGDIESEAERDLAETGIDLSSTVLKVAHHGSDTSTSYMFLREVMPKYVVISVGKDNEYGHPEEKILSRLKDADVTVLRTDKLGEIMFTTDGETVAFKAQ